MVLVLVSGLAGPVVMTVGPFGPEDKMPSDCPTRHEGTLARPMSIRITSRFRRVEEAGRIDREERT
jgi:hypothetical protein